MPQSGLTPLMTTFLSNSDSQQLRSIQPDDVAILSSLAKSPPILSTPSSDQPSSTATEIFSTFNLDAYNVLVSYESTSHVATSFVSPSTHFTLPWLIFPYPSSSMSCSPSHCLYQISLPPPLATISCTLPVCHLQPTTSTRDRAPFRALSTISPTSAAGDE